MISRDERRQFRELLRTFSDRFLDIDLLSSAGDFKNTVVQTLALVGGLGAVVTLLLMVKHHLRIHRYNLAERRILTWPDYDFLISLTMVVIGVATLLIWDNLFPDRRDALALSALPVRMRTIFCARVAAILAVLGTLGVAVHFLPALMMSLAALPDSRTTTLLWSFSAYVVTMALAGLFVFLALVAVQGVLVLILPHRVFQRVSSAVQVGLFFVLACMYFLLPTVAGTKMLPALQAGSFQWVPWLWFVGLHESLLGGSLPVFDGLAGIALRSMGIVAAVVCVAYPLGYRRRVRNLVEQADAAPAASSARMDVLPWLSRILTTTPRERALFEFILRSLARSRQHRMLFALYCGVGLAYGLSSIGSLLFSPAARWDRPRPDLLVPPLFLMFFLLVGMRATFALPLELRANWVFRMNDERGTADALRAARMALLAVGMIPVLAACLPAYLLLWPWPVVVRRAAFLAIAALLLVELLVRNLHKIPFTCSYLPGKSNLKLMFGMYWAIFMLCSVITMQLNMWAVTSVRGFAWVMAAGVIALLLLHGRTAGRKFRFVYEEQPEPVVATLNLRL